MESGDVVNDEEVVTKCFMFKLMADKNTPTKFPPEPDFYKIGPVIGKSSFADADVHFGQYIRTGELVALKKYKLERLVVEDIMCIQDEVVLMRQLSGCDCIMSCLAAFILGNEVVTVMPLMEYRSCLDLISQNFTTGLPENVISISVYDILKALKFIHDRGMIHRAVRASHILIEKQGQAKLTGFRYACVKELNRKNNGKIFEFPRNSVKNLKWLAPEILQQDLKGYEERSDIYSLGITVCEMANGFPPFSECSKLTELMMMKLYSLPPLILDSSTGKEWFAVKDCCGNGDLKEAVYVAKHYSENLHSFKEKCCQTIPEERPNISVLLGHPLFMRVNRNRKMFAELVQSVLPLTERNFEAELMDFGSAVESDERDENVEPKWEF